MPADGTFSAQSSSRAAEGRNGPESNTGHKDQVTACDTSGLVAPVIDWCAVTFPAGTLKKLQLSDWNAFINEVFGVAGKVAMGPIEEKRWNFFPYSAVMIDDTNSLCGRLGMSENGDVHISLTGQGCKHVWNWHKVQAVIENTEARITRVDVAVDDLLGKAINIDKFDGFVRAGAFVSNGRPPMCNLIDDYGSGKGKTLYVGQRGYKQLCVYEKGKQLGDPDSDYCRAELRLYNKHHVIDPRVLTEPGEFFGGAYEVLADFIDGEISRLDAKERVADPSAVAMMRFLKTQAGTSFGLLLQAFGEDNIVSVIKDCIARQGRPGRFKSYTGDPAQLLRNHLRGQENGKGHDPADYRHCG